MSLADIPLLVGVDNPGHGITAMGRPALLRKATWRTSKKIDDGELALNASGNRVTASPQRKKSVTKLKQEDGPNARVRGRGLKSPLEPLGGHELTKFEEKLKESRVRELRKIIELHKGELERYEKTLKSLMADTNSPRRGKKVEHGTLQRTTTNGALSQRKAGNGYLEVPTVSHRRHSDGEASTAEISAALAVDREGLVKSSPAISFRSLNRNAGGVGGMEGEGEGETVIDHHHAEGKKQEGYPRDAFHSEKEAEEAPLPNGRVSECESTRDEGEEKKAMKIRPPALRTSSSSMNDTSDKERKKVTKSKVLIIEDDVLVLRILEKKLKSVFQLNTAATGADGLKLFKGIKPDLVIVDAVMPDMSGFDICEVIRKHSNVPVVFLTSLGKSEERLRAYEVGADDFFVKPVRPLEILERLCELLKGSETLRGKLNQWMGPTETELPMEKVINQILMWKGDPALLEDKEKVSDQLDFMMQVSKLRHCCYCVLCWLRACG
uniref:Response regulatory domain-containing protein n=1 Tax=Palpitomonas bilix TaxID=652834 RepID=A0A7S3GCL1_9EUKA|mmetsp:Transcript_43522/g.113322  ORF Transcript_43522/g.113322 Transcript_43522/m.113322 type:complete len:495 (+) Transcript_43522:277-1761(+)